MIRLEKNNPLPLYAQLKECLRNEVATGVYAADEPLPDERALAEQLGLSRTTVRRAIVELTKEGVLGRIRGRGTFVNRKLAPVPAAAQKPPAVLSAPRVQANTTLALFNSFVNPNAQDGLFYYRILQSMQAAMGQGNPVVFRAASNTLLETFAQIKSDPTVMAVAAMGIIDAELIRGLENLNLPAVLIDCLKPASTTVLDEVTHDGEAAAFQAVNSLFDLGHREIGMMMHIYGNVTGSGVAEAGWQLSEYVQQRLSGYERAFRMRQQNADADLQYQVLANSTSAYAKMRAILKSDRVPTAMFCTTDEIALGVVQAVKDHGWRVPEHLSVIGFGDCGYFCTPLLSTVRIPMEQMGATAAQLILERTASPRQKPRRMVLPTEWMPRATCDLPRG
jgi:DNA-binding LacI/PurR family transcriptional regulator/DNA-binding transcriptional regulator YhcF (GntR family)